MICERLKQRQIPVMCGGTPDNFTPFVWAVNNKNEWAKDLLGSLKRTQDLGSDPNNEGKDSHSWMYKESKKVSEDTHAQN